VVVPALLVHCVRQHLRPQIARQPKRRVALWARVVLALLVHCAHVRRQAAIPAERSGAVGASVGRRKKNGGVLLNG
jgi:hypothetical protein